MKQSNQTDQQLVEDILSGNIDAFSIVINRTERLVTQVVFRMIQNTEDRKDLAQDIYLKVFHNLSRFKFQSKLSTWIAQIAYNTSLNYLNKKKLLLFDNDEMGTEEKLDQMNTSVEWQNQQKIIENKDLTKILDSEIEKLAPLYKTILTLYHQEELSYKEISEITSLPEGTLKSYLFRARRKMRDNLLQNYRKEDL